MARSAEQGKPTPDGQGTPPGQHSQRQQLSREAIIAAALELVEERGLKRLTMRALGERLGVEAMSLYHYFSSKDELLEAIGQIGGAVEAEFGAFFDDMDERGATPGEVVVALGLRYTEFAAEHPDQFELLFNTLPIQFDTWEEFMIGGSTFSIPQMAVQRGIDAGVFHERPGYERDEMAFNLWALVHGLSVLRMTRLRHLEADYERLYRSLLGTLVEQFEGPGRRSEDWAPSPAE
jgi:AcrR family transcriptional regulator